MGTTFSSIHVYGNDAIEDSSLKFRSFSDGWQTCITDLSEIDFNTVLKNAFQRLLTLPFSGFLLMTVTILTLCFM